MDWSLVLASEGIEVTLERSSTDGGFRLLVAPHDELRARGAIRQYLQENRGFEWHHEVPGSDYWFDGRVIFWALAVGFVFMATLGSVESGLFKTELVRQGQWWRAFTAVWLHADIAHLTSNLAAGILFLGLAMARFGAGIALLGSLLAGVLANFFGLLLRTDALAHYLGVFAKEDNYNGLGASGWVMGALGMLVAQAVPRWNTGRRGNKVVLSSLGTGALLFILLGTDQSSDILAHFGGFVCGLLLGTIAAFLPKAWLPGLNRAAFILFVVVVAVTSGLALR
jgi:rhomboid protease GluP